MNRALASVARRIPGDAASYSDLDLLSSRLKALSDAIPGVRSMVLLDTDGTVVASSVDCCSAATSGSRLLPKARDGLQRRRCIVAPPLEDRDRLVHGVFVARDLRAERRLRRRRRRRARRVLRGADALGAVRARHARLLAHGDGKVVRDHAPIDSRGGDGDLRRRSRIAGAAEPGATRIVVGAVGACRRDSA